MPRALQGLRQAARRLRRTPAFTSVAVGTLALVIGANVSIFALLDDALLEPLPVRDPQRLVGLSTLREDGSTNQNFSYARFQEIRTRVGGSARVLAHAPLTVALVTSRGPEAVEAEAVSAGWFAVLGVAPALGRGFLEEEHRIGGPRAVVIGHALWRAAFGGDADVQGRQLSLNGIPFTVVGVAPEGFAGMVRGASTRVWLPLETADRVGHDSELLSNPRVSWLYLVARLRPDVELEQARAAFAALDAERAAGETGERTVVSPAGRGLSYLVEGAALPLAIVMGAVALLLLVACANLAHLLFARSTQREREISIRLSLGATPARIAAQLLTESALLAAVGAGLGLILSIWGGEALASLRWIPEEDVALEPGVDLRVGVFTLTLACVTLAVFGLAPALGAARGRRMASLRGDAVGARGSGPGVAGRDLLVAVQIALSVVLVVGAGLLGRTVHRLSTVDPGFEPSGLWTAALDLDASGYEPVRGTALQEALLQRLADEPGVRAATLARTITPAPGGMSYSGVRLEGYEPAGGGEISFDVNLVGPDYFETLRLPLVRGRGFDRRDRAGTRAVAVVNEAMARRYWSGGDAVGKRILLDPADPASAVEVVGVARTAKLRSLREIPAPNVYLPALQNYAPRTNLIVRSDLEPQVVATLAQRVLRELDAGVPLFNARTLDAHLARASGRERLAATCLVLFAGLAVLLAVLGVYGVISYLAGRRRREIGLRMALGARRGQIIGLLVGRGFAPLTIGLVTGALGTVAAARATAGLLYGVAPLDPATFAAGVGLVAGVALIGSWLPADRASRLDPTRALRED